MSLRFRKRLKIFPGIYINLGLNGVSTTIGPRGANINIGKSGVYLNTALPGTGISNREKLFYGNNTLNSNLNNSTNTIENQLVEQESNNDTPLEMVTSEGLIGLKQHLDEAKKERELGASGLKDEENKLEILQTTLYKKRNHFFQKFFTKKDTLDELEKEVEATSENVIDLRKHYDYSKADINIQFDPEIEMQYKNLTISFEGLIKSKFIWNITTETVNTEIKSSAKSIIDRKQVKFNNDSIDFIKSEHSPFHLQTANQIDLFIYPAFVLIINKQQDLYLIDLKELSFDFHQQRFHEQKENIPPDSRIIEYTWFKVNKDGSRDLRYLGNYQIPVVKYGSLKFSSSSGLSETYYVSNLDVAINFANNLNKYLALLNNTKKQNTTTSTIVPRSNSNSVSILDLDPFAIQAANIILENKIVSTSLIQRRLKIGYDRAGLIMDQLEKLGIIGPTKGSLPRELLVNDLNSIVNIFEDLISHATPPNKSSNKFNLSPYSKEYHNLLIDFSKQIIETTKKLAKDETLIDKIKDTLKEKLPEVFIPYCVLYDMCQILSILSNGSIKKDSLETTGLVLLSPYFLPNMETNFLALDYEMIAHTFENGGYIGVADSIVDISKHATPISITVETNNNNKVTDSKKLESSLSLPITLKIIDHPLFDEYASMLYRFATIIAKADGVVTKVEEVTLKHIFKIIYHPLPDDINNSINISKVDSNETLDQVLNELDSLIGLEGVKQEVKSLINYIKIQKEREKVGLKSSQVSYHCVFTGSPGTGKTTIARIVAKIYMHLGVLKKGHLVETDRSGLIAEFTGQTAIKVNKAVNSALDGVLFIDEAYSLIGENQDDFGKEAVATLIKRMEDDRDKLIVILAGYTQEMKTFIETNPGLKSRFNRYIEFADYQPTELESIFKLLCSKLEYKLTNEAEIKLVQVLNSAFAIRDKSFGNGRFVRNIFEKTLEKQANRIACLPSLTKDILTTITADDIPD